MENNIDWRFAIDLLMPQAEYGWLNPNSSNDILGKYEYIDWRNDISKPKKGDLVAVWQQYIIKNGTFEQQEIDKKEKKDAAIASLKASTNKDIIDLLTIILPG